METKALERHNTVVISNAIELTTLSLVKFLGGDNELKRMNASRQTIADGVAARMNSKLTVSIGG